MDDLLFFQHSLLMILNIHGYTAEESLIPAPTASGKKCREWSGAREYSEGMDNGKEKPDELAGQV
jgi:hypothetical protein